MSTAVCDQAIPNRGHSLGDRKTEGAPNFDTRQLVRNLYQEKGRAWEELPLHHLLAVCARQVTWPPCTSVSLPVIWSYNNSDNTSDIGKYLVDSKRSIYISFYYCGHMHVYMCVYDLFPLQSQ